LPGLRVTSPPTIKKVHDYYIANSSLSLKSKAPRARGASDKGRKDGLAMLALAQADSRN